MFDVNIVLSLVTANPKTNQQFVLSNSDTKIIFPSFKLMNSTNIEYNIINTIRSYFIKNITDEDTKKLFLINIDSHNTNTVMQNNGLNILYGLILPSNYQTVDSCYWHSFNFHDITIPNELTIIGETVRRGF